MGERKKWMSIVAIVTAGLFPAATSGAHVAALGPLGPSMLGATARKENNIRVVVHQARQNQVATLQRQYERETGAVVVPLIVKNVQRSLMSDDLAQSYAEREAAAQQLQQFEGGDVVIAVSVTAILVVAIVVLLIILLVD